jgi:hypothetical protein
MEKSARILGEDYGLTAQEMNFILKEEGYLEGEAGNYVVTEKGAKFAGEGKTSYGYINGNWSTRTWNDEIVDNLDITNDRKREIRQAILIAKQNTNELKDHSAAIEGDSYSNEDTDSINVNEALVKAVGAILIVASVYGIYKATPYIKDWWGDKALPSLEKWRDKAARSLKKMKNKITGKEEETEN